MFTYIKKVSVMCAIEHEVVLIKISKMVLKNIEYCYYDDHVIIFIIIVYKM